MKEQLLALFELQKLDSGIDALKRQFASLDRGELEDKSYRASDAAFKEADTALRGVTAMLTDTELEQKAVEEKQKEYEAKLYGGSVHIPKELQAMQDEVEMLGRQRAKLDEKILGLMDTLEGAKRTEVQAKSTKKVARAALKVKVEGAKKDGETLAAQYRILTEQRKTAAEAVGAALLKRYESARATRGGIVIAALEDGNACGGCKMAVPSILVTSIRDARDIEVCMNCGRILIDLRK